MRILVVLLAASAAAIAQPGVARVALLQDDLPGLDSTAMQATARVLEGGSIAYASIGLADLSSHEAFNAARFDTLILNHSDHLPVAAGVNLLTYLEAGGDLVFLGASGFVHRQSLALPAFSRYEPYALDGIETVDTVGGQDIVSGVETRGSYAGWSAVGFTRRAAKFIPLLAAKDRYGRTRGWACGLLTHYGEYRGSNWLLFGIDTPAFYWSDGYARALRAALGRMRGDGLWRAAEGEHQKAVAARTRLNTAPPAGFVHASPDGKRLLTPGGKPLFLTGVNYHRGLDQGEWGPGAFDDTVFEDDFRKAREAGINCIRLGPASRFYDSPEIVRECARKYGIYVIVILNWGTQLDYVANAERVARMYADEPMVLGYDLQNEPTAEALAGLTFDGKPSPALALEKGKPQPDAVAAFRAVWPKAWDREVRNSVSTFPGFFEKPAAAEYTYFRDAMDQTLSQWIARHIEAIRKHDRHHLVSVGYNNILAVLGANRQLDFLTHHVYEAPYSYESVMINLTTMDRLAHVFPDKPITLGEFGYSNGLVTNDGRYLDFHTSAVGEMAHYLYALAKGYSGVTKWVLTDWHWDVIGKAGDLGRPTQIYEAYFGMYYYDGHPPGLERAKPIVPAVRFLREYADDGGEGGEIQIVRAANSIGAGYLYRAPNALFVGDGHYESAGLEFRAQHPANVMLRWKGTELRVMSTADAEITIDPKAFLPGVSADTLRVWGKCGQWRVEGGRIVITALEGELLTIAARK